MARSKSWWIVEYPVAWFQVKGLFAGAVLFDKDLNRFRGNEMIYLDNAGGLFYFSFLWLCKLSLLEIFFFHAVRPGEREGVMVTRR
jgi:hypothetical protein